MLEDVAAFFRRFHHELEAFPHFDLAGELGERRRPQRNLKGRIGLWWLHDRWSNGVMESWSNGTQRFITSLLQYSITPSRLVRDSLSAPARCRAAARYNRPDRTRCG